MPGDYVRTFTELGFIERGKAGKEIYGVCPFCARWKFYLNGDTGQWSCKTGHCAKSGNLYTFLSQWYEHRVTETSVDAIRELAKDRGISLSRMTDHGVVVDGDKYYIPVRNEKQSIVNFRIYRQGNKLMGLPGVESMLFGVEKLAAKPRATVYICEGEWDKMALEELLDGEDVLEEEVDCDTEDSSWTSKMLSVVISVPGATVFKDGWVPLLAGRDIVLCYDNDIDGQRGAGRAALKLQPVAKSIKSIKWPDVVPDKFDMRDFLRHDGTLAVLQSMIENFTFENVEKPGGVVKDQELAYPALSSGTRPTFSQTLKAYEQYLFMTKDMIDALKVIYAVIISNQIEGDPLWVHIVSPPGGGKTELLMSCSTCAECLARSTVSPHSLVSGFNQKGGVDPSLIPKLFGKTFIIKDFTEVLRTNPMVKDEIYGVLRGAYDGKVERQFGNGVIRNYSGFFNVLTGVTHAIFGESTAILGERFLMYFMPHSDTQYHDQVIGAALDNVGSEAKIRDALCVAANKFLEYSVDPEDIPILPDEMRSRIIALSTMVSKLRSTVEKDFFRDVVPFRPQTELAPRLAKQLKKLCSGLALLNDPPTIDEDVYKIVAKVAMDTTIGWNFDVVRTLIYNDGNTLKELAIAADVPVNTLRDRLDQLNMLGVLQKDKNSPGGRGAPETRYYLKQFIRDYWQQARLELVYPPPENDDAATDSIAILPTATAAFSGERTVVPGPRRSRTLTAPHVRRYGK